LMLFGTHSSKVRGALVLHVHHLLIYLLHGYAAVLDGLVGDQELCEVVADRLGSHLHVDALPAVVHAHDAADHLPGR
jgi:hypothetical protein